MIRSRFDGGHRPVSPPMDRLNFVALFSAQTAGRPERCHRAPLRSGRSVHQATSLRKSKGSETISELGLWGDSLLTAKVGAFGKAGLLFLGTAYPFFGDIGDREEP